MLHDLKSRSTDIAPGLGLKLEGADGADWVVVDAGGVVAHVLTEDAREIYDLEGMWGGNGRVFRLPPRQTPQTIGNMSVEANDYEWMMDEGPDETKEQLMQVNRR